MLVRGTVVRLAGMKMPKIKNSSIIRFLDYESDDIIPCLNCSIIIVRAKRNFYQDLDESYKVSDNKKLLEDIYNAILMVMCNVTSKSRRKVTFILIGFRGTNVR